MSANVLSFQPRVRGAQPWTNDELAELYRVVDILGQAGLAVETDMGMSDEGDPWFVFCRSDCGDVIAHFARIDGQFVAASVAVDATYRGANFRQIVARMVESQPLVVPRADRSTRLLMHPSVVLTAFVATALAHSEKSHSDPQHAVEAKWDHHNSPAHDIGAATRHGKASWLESFRSVMEELRGGQDVSAPAGQAISLASLIAIAMAAMQPLVDKLSMVASAVVDGVHSVEAALHPAAEHILAALSDISLISTADAQTLDGHQTQINTAQTPVVAKATGDLGTDAHVSVSDVASAIVLTSQKLVALIDDVAHLAAPPVVSADGSTDAATMALLSAQKATALLVDSTHSATIYSAAATSASVSTVSFSDVSQQALQILNIHLDSKGADLGDTSASHSDANVASTAGDGATILSSGTGGASDAGQLVSTAATTSAGGASSAISSAIPAAPQVVDISADNGAAVIQAISSFATSTSHLISDAYTPTTSLLQSLAQYETGGQPLKIVVFESSSLSQDIFQFSSNVVFVDEKYLTHDAALVNPGGNLVLDLADGGTVTLVGVATITHTTAVA